MLRWCCSGDGNNTNDNRNSRRRCSGGAFSPPRQGDFAGELFAQSFRRPSCSGRTRRGGSRRILPSCRNYCAKAKIIAAQRLSVGIVRKGDQGRRDGSQTRIELQFTEAGVHDDFDTVFASIRRQPVGALFVAVSGLFTSRRDQLVMLSARSAIPASYSFREFTAAGGLMSYGTSLTDGFRQAGVYVGLILKGTKPSVLPIMQPTKFELASTSVQRKRLVSKCHRRCSPSPMR